MNTIAIIPSRFASSRFPGKPLALINGKPMVQHVYERCLGNFDYVVVATDDQIIYNTVKDFGGQVLMTNDMHNSGTDRCAEAARLLEEKIQFDIVVNVQGDEPFVQTEQFSSLLACFDNPETQIATLLSPIKATAILFDTNKVKAVVDTNGRALYFSRQAIPFVRDFDPNEWLLHHRFFLHLGIYAYRANVLQQITNLQPGILEQCEKLEQLRWLENGFTIQTAVTEHINMGVDTPLDLENLLKNINKQL
ncbi:MAG: 3-deoxy-manno-octulosonate cytidylyltransferase [Prolixibacteraceae bacterium]|jgi:3-deoxy-manno-octulosonate cytidylyltransferase (CMP-KDO synthetase)|nr:3-deoxy-manno-octulosonate cytidylyltransferase [Prolixibacteraceae bacterium]